MDIEYSNTATTTEVSAEVFPPLPKELSTPSFFVLNSSEQNVVLEHFLKLARSGNQEEIDKLLTSPLLSSSPVSIPSLLSRVWNSYSNPLRARVIALNRFASHLANAGSSLDFQGFLPHLIAALSSTANDVREAAAASLLTYRQSLEKLSSKAKVIGLDELYVEDESLGGLKWLSLAERQWLVKSVLIPKLEECRLDRNYIIRLLGEVLNGAGKRGKKDQYLYLNALTDNRHPTSVMVFLASHVVCSGSAPLQFSLLRILNDYTIESSAAIKLKAQSIAPLLERCKDASYVKALLEQDEQIDSSEFTRNLAAAVGPGASSAQINLLMELINLRGALASAACQQLAILFPTTGTNTQLQIAQQLTILLESGPQAIAKVASSTLDSIAIPTTILQTLLEDIKIEVDSRQSSPSRKRQRTDSARSSPGLVPEGVSQSTRRLTLLLEVLERQHPGQHIALIPTLFGLLDRLLAVESDTRTTLSYPKQMVLSCLISMVKGLQVWPLSQLLTLGNFFT